MDESRLLVNTEREQNGEKKNYTPEEVGVILAELHQQEITATQALVAVEKMKTQGAQPDGDLQKAIDDAQQELDAVGRRLCAFFDSFVEFANRTMEFLNNERGNLGEAIVTWNGRIADKEFKKAGGVVMSLAEKIKMVSNLVDLVFREGRIKDSQ